MQLPGLPHLHVHSVFCIGRNYAEHAKELNNEVPEQPLVFLKPAGSIITNGGTIILPARSKEVHHEVELVVAIGKRGKNISETEALDYIAGYAVGIDVTARDIQQQAKSKGHPWSVAKGFDTFAPIGNFIPSHEIKDPQDLELHLEVNRNTRQHGNTKDMIFPVASLVAYLSTIYTLSPGDLIFTGTPKGVSAIADGDQIYASLNKTLSTITISVSKE